MKKPSLLLFLFTVTLHVLSQDEVKVSNFSFSHQPFYMVKNMLKLDFDVALGNGHWIIVSPMVAARENYYEDDEYSFDVFDDYNRLLGYGLTIGHRMYGKASQLPSGVYFSYQAGWKHFKIDYREETWGNITHDGYDAITYDYFTMSTIIDKIGLDILIGYQFLIKESLLLDIYFGGGIRYSIKDFTGIPEKEFSSGIIDYGYTGLLPQGGIRLGIVL